MFNIGDRKLRNVLVSCDHGLMVINRNDTTITSVGGFLLEHGNNNTIEADVTMKALVDVENPVIIDVGANIGTYTTWVARWFANKGGKVYAFEPQREVFQMLCANMAINNIFNVYAYECGISDEEKYIDIDVVDYDTIGSFAAFSLTHDPKRYQNTNKKQHIKVTTIDKFVEEQQLEKVDYIKIDAEGLDLEVLCGAHNTISKFKPDLYIEYLNLGSSKDEDTSDEGYEKLDKILKEMGYNTVKIHHDIYATVKPL